MRQDGLLKFAIGLDEFLRMQLPDTGSIEDFNCFEFRMSGIFPVFAISIELVA